jgi:hypothetical protein
VNLPKGVKTDSLWPALHDAELVSVRSNLLARTVVLTFEIAHVRKFHKLPKDLQFRIHLAGVQSARVVRYAIWPGEFKVPAGASRAQEARLVTQYQDKCREESASWNEFEAAISPEKQMVLEISNAILAGGPPNQMSLLLNGRDGHHVYYELTLRAERVEFQRSDGESIEMAKFVKLGEAYWEAFSSKRKRSTEPQAN